MMLSEAEKQAARAAKFGVVAAAAAPGAGLGKRKADAVIAAAPPVDLETLKKRAGRFGLPAPVVPLAPAEVPAKAAARAARFGNAPAAAAATATGKPGKAGKTAAAAAPAIVLSAEDQAKAAARAARFAAAAQ